jgi:hypothetical protein
MTLSNRGCGRTRRSFLADTGLGFTGLALGAMMFRDKARADQTPPDGRPHFAPKAKNVIWIFMCGGVSHLESFDPKLELNRYHGRNIADTPYAEAAQRERNDIIGGNPNHGNRRVLMGLATGVTRHGKSGLLVGDWWRHTGARADDIAVVRSMWTTHNDHGAMLQYHTGRHPREGPFPTIGSWTCYGLGTLNQNLPEYVVLGMPPGDCCGGEWAHGSGYLGPEFAGVRLNPESTDPLPYVRPLQGRSTEQQQSELSLLGRLNSLAGIDYPHDPQLRARIRAYELAYGMQTEVPETFAFDREPAHIRELYGMTGGPTVRFGRQCLAARRLVERGVRFVQLFHGGGGGGEWDAHSGIRANHGRLSSEVDRPIAGLLTDLKQRGMLDETLVVWGTEFGRSPGAEGGDGRDHHPQAFCAWLAGGGIKGGVIHGQTDPIGFHSVGGRHYVTDIHATVLHQLGLDPQRLEIPGRQRLAIDRGRPIMEIIA